MKQNDYVMSYKARNTKSLLSFLTLFMLILMAGCEKDDDPVPPTFPDVQIVAENLVSPIGLVAVPDNTNRLFVIDQAGMIRIIDAGGNLLPAPFLDVTSKMVALTPQYDERGLLGLAFHPNYSTNGRFFIYYNAPPRAGGPEPGENWNNLSRIAEYRVSAADANIADAGSERIILEFDDPQSNHNGGTLAFGDDGYLYIAVGDGGSANDVAPGHVEDWYAVNAGGNGQDVNSNLFGNILRIDINTTNPYNIPPDNPFVATAGRDEIYAYGFRNPFRFSFDMEGTNALYAGDAGQVLYEEISIVTKGGNYGWNVKEGTHCFNAADNENSFPTCPTVDDLGNALIDPIIELNNWNNPAGGRATTIIGGNVYRGSMFPNYAGKYIFGTFSQSQTTADGELFIASPAAAGLWSYDEISLKSSPTDIGYYLKGFGQDNNGEIYITVSTILGPSGAGGKILKLVPFQ
jgi:glucose/arabinose dehydrogenase